MSEPNQVIAPMTSMGGPPNNAPLNNGTNNGAGRIGPTNVPPITTCSIIHNNVATGPPAKTAPNTNRLAGNNNGQQDQKRQRGGSRGGQHRSKHNRNN
ncbi:hypothetical protein QE152_g38082 [Popillia japonica]|uniref:Uncharacterized protein n=1 Tax=Popillia japonica TaxID=7064 RepID=A0AAW1I8G6_POPJA